MESGLKSTRDSFFTVISVVISIILLIFSIALAICSVVLTIAYDNFVYEGVAISLCLLIQIIWSWIMKCIELKKKKNR